MRRLLVPGWLAVQAVGVWWLAGGEQAPAAPLLDGFPAALGEWRAVSEDPAAGQMRELSRADRLLSRYYGDGGDAPLAQLLVAWYRSQRDGVRQPHQPKVCLAASGWTALAESGERIETADGVVAARRYLVARGAERTAVLYWYQTRHRVLAGEWEMKFWVGVDGVRERRSDAALVRITVPAPAGEEARAFERAARLARRAYPALRAWWPR
jgi:EpsI family protein